MHLNRQKVLILSGGRGSRFGTPKALAIYNGETFLDTILSKCLSLDLDIYVVLNSQLNDLLGINRTFTTIIGDSTKDMYDSILKGIEGIGDFSQLVIWPVDHPFVSANSVKHLLSSGIEEKFVVPSFSMRLGHPVVFPDSALKHLPQCHSLKELINKVGRSIVEVNDSGILHNINKKEDLP
jgi:CTP:molybdopterin cytidylyltransferase MocA